MAVSGELILRPYIFTDLDPRKTELLLELAFRCRTSRNVFFIRAYDAASLDQAFLELAMSIGHDILALRHPSTDVHAMWLQLGPSERINAFRNWLGEEQNQPSLFIVDDIDGIPDDASIQAAFPRDARCVLFSTRDPSIIDSLDRECKELRITSMDVDEMALLMETVLRRSTSLQVDITERELESIAKIVDGHALGACRAISYIIQVLAQTAKSRPVEAFLDMITSRDWKARLRFLRYKPRFGQSIMETYEVSLQRIRKHQDEAILLLELIAFLSSTDDNLDFRQFLDIERPWLTQFEGKLANFETFDKGLSDKNELLAELEHVSMGLRPSFSKPLQLHPLWTECTLQRATHDGRCRWLGQILLLCYESSRREECIDVLRPFVLNCVDIAERFYIDLDRLVDSADLSHWLSVVRKPTEDSTVSQEVEAVAEAEKQTPAVKDDEVETEACYRICCCLQEDCHDLQRRLASLEQESAGTVPATEKQQTLVTQFTKFLMRLRKLEETTHKGHFAIARIQQAHIKTYDILIEIRPLLMQYNQKLTDQLQTRKRNLQQQYGMHA